MLDLIFGLNRTQVDAEYEDIVEAASLSKLVSDSQAWRNLFKREYRPMLTLAVMIPFFQQWTGINVRLASAPQFLAVPDSIVLACSLLVSCLHITGSESLLCVSIGCLFHP